MGAVKKAKLAFPALYKKQRDAIYDPARYSIIEASTKAGKTAGCIIWLLDRAWTTGRLGTNHWWIAPVSDQANIAFTRMRQGLRIKPAPVINLTLKTITLANGATIWFKSADRPDSLYGDDVYDAVADEATRMKEDAFVAIRSTLTATGGHLRVIGNVKGRKNWAFKMARKAQAGAPGMAYHKLTALDAVDAGIFSRQEFEDARAVLPDHIFRELYLAEPSDDGGNPFGLKAIEECVVNELSSATPVVYGWDLAKSHDWTVGIGIDKSGTVCRFERFQKSWNDTITSIRTENGHSPALVDSTGVGDPVLEQLQKGRDNYEGFKFTSQSKQQLMEGLAVAIHRREIRFPDGPIRAELESFEYEYTRTGARYSAPEGMHDDCVVALALAVAHWRAHAHSVIEYTAAPTRREREATEARARHRSQKGGGAW